MREWILNALDVEDTSAAWELLQQYEEIYGAENKVEKQFCLIMRVQCMQQEKKPAEEWLPVLKQALYETMPNALHKPLDSLILAAEELNLIVEYVYYQEGLSSVELYEELFSYASRMDIWSQAKLCPKIALFFSKWVNAQEENLPLEEVATLAERANRMCNDGIEALRIHAKIYFLLEVFEEKKNLISLLMKQKLDAETKKRKNRQYRAELKKMEQFGTLLQSLYTKYNIPAHTCAYTCFYRENEVYSINEVLYARRLMFGLRREDLEDICTSRTLQRIELEQTNVQGYIQKSLFQKFGLSPELYHSQICTDKEEVIQLEREYRLASNSKYLTHTKQLLQQLKSMLSMENLQNKQYILCEEAQLGFLSGELSKAEYAQQLKEVLELTVPYEAVMKPMEDVHLKNGRMQPGVKYFTIKELKIIGELIRTAEEEEKRAYIQVVLDYYNQIEKQQLLPSVMIMYSFIVGNAQSWVGNLGEYTLSDSLNHTLLRESLKVRRVNRIHSFWYNLLWNAEQRREKLSSAENVPDRGQRLQDCILLAQYAQEDFATEDYRKKLTKYKKN